MFTCEEGDHLTLLNVYTAFERARFDERWCHRNFVSYKNLMRAREIVKQLRSQLKRFSIPLVRNDGNPDSILKCIVKGFFANAGEPERVCGMWRPRLFLLFAALAFFPLALPLPLARYTALSVSRGHVTLTASREVTL